MSNVLNRESVPAVRWVPDAEIEHEGGWRQSIMMGRSFEDTVGAYRVYTMHRDTDIEGQPAGFLVVLPGVGVSSLAFAGGPDDGEKAHWNWNGSLDRPTLTPSIRCQRPQGDGTTLEWHGFLTDGQFVSC